MIRVALSLGLCLAALSAGLVTACLAAKNRVRAAELDARQRWCETFSRQNRLLRSEIAEREWRLLSGEEDEEPAWPAEARVVEVEH